MKSRAVVLVSHPHGVAQAEALLSAKRTRRCRKDTFASALLSVGRSCDARRLDRRQRLFGPRRDPVPSCGRWRWAVSGRRCRSFGRERSSRDGSAGRNSPMSRLRPSQREGDRPSVFAALGVLGINGVTALVGLETIGEPRPGETVLVSTAAGAVGSAVGQIAKILGCRAVGIAGGSEKARTCRELSVDAAIDYRGPGLAETLAAACPDGVSVYFLTSGGDQRCGLAEARGWQTRGDLRHRVLFIVGSVAKRPAPRTPSACEAGACSGLRRTSTMRTATSTSVAKLAFDWVRAGKLRYSEDVLDGIEACPRCACGTLSRREQG